MRRLLDVALVCCLLGCEDTEPPSWPAGAELGLSYSQVLRDSPPTTEAELIEFQRTLGLDFRWPAASDNVGVTAYRIRKGDAVIVTVDGATHTLHFETSAPVATYSVEAGDAAGNWAAGPSVENRLNAQQALAPPGAEAPAKVSLEREHPDQRGR
jgi:hypothetical protein